ncbi:MAG: hypothetical protein GXY07_05915 [Candidatus Hydrogenedentes bacterium]|nr:hypothetical protein [Candidatus Hydrogenedentota bacterium]
MKRFLRITAKICFAFLLICLASGVFAYFQGIQYTLALLTGSLRDPYFDSTPYPPEENCFGGVPCVSGPIRVLSYNVFCRICGKDNDDPWDIRVDRLRQIVERYDPDLIGSQELGGWRDIAEFLPEGDTYGVVTFEFGPWTYADSALFYRKSRYDLLDSGQFWLSPNPGLPFGFGWLKLSAPRYLSWACLRDRFNGFTFLFLNSHLDNNTLNKESSAPLIFNTFSPHAARLPVIFTGDFNTNATTERYGVLQKGGTDEVIFQDAAFLAPRLELQVYDPASADPVATTDFQMFEHTIDHIFLAGPLQSDVIRWVIDYNTYGKEQKEASDHPAVYAELQFISDLE